MAVETVHVWLVDSDLSPAVLNELAGLLDEDERQRVALLHQDRAWRRFVAAHAAARLIVAGRLQAPPREVRWRRGEHGKPELANPRSGLRVSLSHSGDLAMVALTDRRPVGVDIQQASGHLDATRLATRFFPAPEAELVAAAAHPAEGIDRFVRLWVRKEACVKAAGGRLMHGLTLPVAGAGTEVLVCDPTGTLPCPHRVHDVPAPPGFRAAVALADPDPYRIVRHRWAPASD